MQMCRCCEDIRWFAAYSVAEIFFHLSAYWRTLQQCRSRTYVSVIRRKWIRPKRKPTRALNCKKAGRTRAQTPVSFIRGKRIPPPLLPPSIRCIYLFLPLYLSIHLSVRLPFADHFYADATISPSLPYFSSFHLYSSSARCVPLSFSRVCHSRTVARALTRFSRIENGDPRRNGTTQGITKQFASVRVVFLIDCINPALIQSWYERFSYDCLSQ